MRNVNIENKINNKNESIEKTQLEINKLPNANNLYKVYKSIRFYITYQINNKKYIVDESSESHYIEDFPDAAKVRNSETGFFPAQVYYDLRGKSEDLSIEDIAELSLESMRRKNLLYQSRFRLKLITPKASQKWFFEKIEFKEFLNKQILNEDYVNKLYEDGYITKTRSEFSKDVADALQYLNKDYKIKYKLEGDIKNITEEIAFLKNKFLSYKTIQSRLISGFLIILIIAYPLRFLILGVIWARKTLKE